MHPCELCSSISNPSLNPTFQPVLRTLSSRSIILHNKPMLVPTELTAEYLCTLHAIREWCQRVFDLATHGRLSLGERGRRGCVLDHHPEWLTSASTADLRSPVRTARF